MNAGPQLDPRGRCDVLVVRLAELACRRHVEPRLGGIALWDGGVGGLVEALVEQSSIPKQPITLVDIARELGLVRVKR